MAKKKEQQSSAADDELFDAYAPVTMVNDAGEQIEVKPMHVRAWEQYGYKVKE